MKLGAPFPRATFGGGIAGQMARYGIVVACGYLLAIAFYSGEQSVGVPPYAALGVAFVLNGLFNFALLRAWAFPPSGRSVGSDLRRFCIVASASFVVNYSSFAVLYSVAELRATTAQRVSILIAAPVTFLASRLWSFRVCASSPEHSTIVAGAAAGDVLSSTRAPWRR